MRARYGHLAFTIARYLTTAFALGVLVGAFGMACAAKYQPLKPGAWYVSPTH